MPHHFEYKVHLNMYSKMSRKTGYLIVYHSLFYLCIEHVIGILICTSSHHQQQTFSLTPVTTGGIGYQVSDITSTKCSFGYFSLDTPTPFAVLTVFLDNT